MGNKLKPKIRSVKFNVLMNMILTSSQMIFPLITLPYVSRVLSTYGTGAVAFAQSVLSYFSLAALLGIQTYGVKACAAVRDNPHELSRTVRELLRIILISTSCVFLLYNIAIFLIPRFSENRILFFTFGLGLWLASFGVEWFYQAIEQYGYITVRNIIFKIIGLILMFLFVNTKDDYYIYGVIVLFSGYGMNVLNIIRLRKFIDYNKNVKLRIMPHLKRMIWYLIASTSSGMYIQTDMLLLGFLNSTHVVGLYQLVYKIKNVLVQAVNSVGNVMLPRMTYYKSNNGIQEVSNLIAKNFNFVGVIFTSIFGISFLCSEDIVLILGGRDFAESALPLILVTPAVFFSASNIILGNILITDSRENEWAIINFIGLIISYIYAAILISQFGIIGAAITNSLTEFTVFIMRSIRSKKYLINILPRIDFHKIIFAGIISVICVSVFKTYFEFTYPISSLLVSSFMYLFIFFSLMLIIGESFVRQLFSSVFQVIRLR